jgi:hypothetical protein
MRVAHKRTEMGSRDDFTPSEIALARREGVRLERRFSQTIRESYVANVCPARQAFIGSFYLHEHTQEWAEMAGRKVSFVKRFPAGWACEACEGGAPDWPAEQLADDFR